MTPVAFQDTIAAVSTGPGGALAIVRISGPDSAEIAQHVWFSNGKKLHETPRKMRLGHVLGPAGETCMAVFLKGPHSYTGEDSVELQCHGGNSAPERLLEAVLRAGARMAAPGEFTRRAFLNGKMDLTQAEAVLDLIQARTREAAALAERQMAGRLGNKIREAAEPLAGILAEIESRLDFPEEELDWKTPQELLEILSNSRKILSDLIAGSRAGAILRDGVRLVIAGAPNTGKSSLLNRLLGFDRAIVTEFPGTTRDTVDAEAVLHGIRFVLTDTAGLRHSTPDPVESAGIARSENSIRGAELILWMLDSSLPAEPQEKNMEEALKDCNAKILPCWNKIDLLPDGTRPPEIPGRNAGAVSALTGAGIENLLDLLNGIVRKDFQEREPETAVSRRHEELLHTAAEQLDNAVPELEAEDWELASIRIREALRALKTITGENASPDVLDEIFSRFCIGK